MSSSDTARYAERKVLILGLMDLQAFTSTAHELKLHLTDTLVRKTTFYYIYITMIVLAMVLQATVGIILIFKRNLFAEDTKHDARNTIRANDWVIAATLIFTMLNHVITA